MFHMILLLLTIQHSTAFFYYNPSGYELLTSPKLQRNNIFANNFRNGLSNEFGNGFINAGPNVKQNGEICIDPGFVCENPYDKSNTLRFECQDGGCPTGYKCCEQKCFQHKICMMAGTQEDIAPSKTCGHWPQDCKRPYSYYTTYRFICKNDNQCPSNYKCCHHNCFRHKVCLITKPQAKTKVGKNNSLSADALVEEIKYPATAEPNPIESSEKYLTTSPDEISTKETSTTDISITDISTTGISTTEFSEGQTSTNLTTEKTATLELSTELLEGISLRIRSDETETSTDITNNTMVGENETKYDYVIEDEKETENNNKEEDDEYAEYNYHYQSKDDDNLVDNEEYST